MAQNIYDSHCESLYQYSTDISQALAKPPIFKKLEDELHEMDVIHRNEVTKILMKKIAESLESQRSLKKISTILLISVLLFVVLTFISSFTTFFLHINKSEEKKNFILQF